MKTTNWAHRMLPLIALAIAAPGARSASAQAPVPATPASPSTADSASSSATGKSMDTVRVVAAASKSRFANERLLIAGNRILAKELARYDRKIVELERRLDSLRIEAVHRWKDVREMESAALATRERRIEMERKLAQLESDTAGTRPSKTVAGPR